MKISQDVIRSLIDIYIEEQSSLQELADDARKDVKGKIADCPKDFSWHLCYSVSLVELLSALFVVTGQEEWLEEISKSDKPQEAVLGGLDSREPRFRDDLSEWPPEYIMLGCTIALYHSLRSMSIHGWSLNALMDDYVRTRSERSLLLMLGIDPTIVSSPLLQRDIALAHFKQDEGFFTKLGNKIKTRTKRQKQDHGALRFILAVLRESGDLHSLSAQEAYDLLAVEMRLYPQTGNDPVRGLERFIQRWKKETATNLSDFPSSSN